MALFDLISQGFGSWWFTIYQSDFDTPQQQNQSINSRYKLHTIAVKVYPFSTEVIYFKPVEHCYIDCCKDKEL